MIIEDQKDKGRGVIKKLIQDPPRGTPRGRTMVEVFVANYAPEPPRQARVGAANDTLVGKTLEEAQEILTVQLGAVEEALYLKRGGTRRGRRRVSEQLAEAIRVDPDHFTWEELLVEVSAIYGALQYAAADRGQQKIQRCSAEAWLRGLSTGAPSGEAME